MKTTLLRLAAPVFVLLAFSLGRAEPVANIYDAQTGFLSGWSVNTWGNLDAQHSKLKVQPGGAISLLITPSANSSNFAGVILEAGMAGSINLTDELRSKGEIRLVLRNGLDLAGKPAQEQIVQAMLSFLPVGGKSFNGRYEQILLKAVADGETDDGWQVVTLSIPTHLAGRVEPSTPVRLRAVYFQFVDQPQASFFVGACTLEEGAKPQK